MASANDEVVLREFLAVAVKLREAAQLPELTGTALEKAAATGAEAGRTAVTEALGGFARVMESSPVYQAARQDEDGGGVTSRLEALGGFARLIESSPVYQAVRQDEDGGGVMSRVLRSGLGMAPLARLIVGLFTGDDEEEPPPLVKYALPPRLRFEMAEGPGASLLGADYGQDGLPRAYAAEQPAGREAAASEAMTGPQVTIQVQAMDSRSFLDHKEEIARAVREAMLNTHSLNDVVNDL